MVHVLVTMLCKFVDNPSIYIKLYIGFGQPRDANPGAKPLQVLII